MTKASLRNIGRSEPGSGPRSKYVSRKNSPPATEPWIWMTRPMMESPAFQQLSGHGHKVVWRIAVEHMAHGGNENGNLTVTFDDFEQYGIRRESIKAAIAEAVALGWIVITQKGCGGQSGDQRVANKFALSWLATAATDPSNGWKRIATKEDAKAAVAKIRKFRTMPKLPGPIVEISDFSKPMRMRR